MKYRQIITQEQVKKDMLEYFKACVDMASSIPDFMAQFMRLYGFSMPKTAIDFEIDKATGRMSDIAKKFQEFVHDYVYLPTVNEFLKNKYGPNSALTNK